VRGDGEDAESFASEVLNGGCGPVEDGRGVGAALEHRLRGTLEDDERPAVVRVGGGHPAALGVEGDHSDSRPDVATVLDVYAGRERRGGEGGVGRLAADCRVLAGADHGGVVAQRAGLE
jgi:hypothetical protein